MGEGGGGGGGGVRGGGGMRCDGGGISMYRAYITFSMLYQIPLFPFFNTFCQILSFSLTIFKLNVP